MINELNNFWTNQKGYFHSVRNFKESGVYHFYRSIFGDLIYTEEKTHNFIGLDYKGMFYDEIYYPLSEEKLKGTIIPRIFHESNLKVFDPAIEWKSVASKGFSVLKDQKINQKNIELALKESFVPFGLNSDLNMSKTVNHAYFGTRANYDYPEEHYSPEYMVEMTKEYMKSIPRPPSIIGAENLHTTDIVQYLYDPNEVHCEHGPYKFHMDYFKRLLFMFFSYYSKDSPILGRELLVGKRKPYNFFDSNFFYDEITAGKNPIEAIGDDDIFEYHENKISNQLVILMNTLNPIFVHKVNKLKARNEIVLLTHYIWSERFN